MNWDEMSPRERDVLVAEKVMGLQRQVDFGTWEEHDWHRNENGTIDEFAMDADTHNGPACKRCGYGYCHHCQDGPTETCEINAPKYTTSIGRAWEVVEMMKSKHWNMDFINAYVMVDQTHHCLADFRNGNGCGRANSLNAPEAICLAALRAVGVDV